MIVSVIVAVNRDLAIGYRGDMLYHLREDLRRFRALTMGKPVVMGRRTFESLPGGALPGRTNIVITSNPEWTAPETLRAASIEEALMLAATYGEEAFIIGGERVYRESLQMADRVYLTEIDDSGREADTYFPHLEEGVWKVASEMEYATDSRTGERYRFVDYVRH